VGKFPFLTLPLCNRSDNKNYGTPRRNGRLVTARLGFCVSFLFPPLPCSPLLQYPQVFFLWGRRDHASSDRADGGLFFFFQLFLPVCPHAILGVSANLRSISRVFFHPPQTPLSLPTNFSFVLMGSIANPSYWSLVINRKMPVACHNFFPFPTFFFFPVCPVGSKSYFVGHKNPGLDFRCAHIRGRFTFFLPLPHSFFPFPGSAQKTGIRQLRLGHSKRWLVFLTPSPFT